jgi:hypothetical protein
VEGAEFFGIGDGFDGVAEAVGDGAEAEIEGFEDGLAAGMGALFHAAILSAFLFAGCEAFLNSILAAFLAEMLGESHGAGAVGLVADAVDFAEDAGPVNWVGAIEDVGDEAIEETAGDVGEEVVVPDGVAEETADGFGFEGAEDEDAVGRAADGVEWDGGELDEAEGEVGQEGAEEVECSPPYRWYLLILWEGRRIQPLCGGRGTGLFPDSCVARRLRILIRALLAP